MISTAWLGAIAAAVIASAPPPLAPPAELPPLAANMVIDLPGRMPPHGMRYYPPAAFRNGVAGVAVLACRIDDEGWLKDCTVLGERPEHQGFGKAALAIAMLRRFGPQTKDGQPTAGRLLVMPFHFNFK